MSRQSWSPREVWKPLDRRFFLQSESHGIGMRSYRRAHLCKGSSMSPLRTVGFAVALCLAATAPAQAQIASVSVRSVDALIADFQYLAPLVGEEDAVKTMKQLLARGI